jgi:capsular polysaccharide biosynthesis protein
MKWRRLLNEAEIAAELSKSGFETVFLEEMDAGQQIDLVRRAEWIVAPNGSALLNLIFSDPAVKLLILSQPGLFNWGTFQGPMRSLGYHPVWLCGEEVAAGNFKHADYSVSIKHLRKALAGMGLKEATR